MTQFYEDRACLWDAKHEEPIKKDKKEEEMGNYN